MQLKALYLQTGMLLPLRNFYQQVLGCTVMDSGDGFMIKAGATDLYFHHATGSPTYHFAFDIPYHQVTAALEWTAKRVPLLNLVDGQPLANFSNWLAKAFYFFDPAGNIVEFIGRAPVNNSGSAPFSGTSLLNVSEIGLVTDDVSKTCRQLHDAWQVPLFTRQPAAPNFAAAGDDHGLFIIVSAGRLWYPTRMPAQKAPLKAVFSTGAGISHTLEWN